MDVLEDIVFGNLQKHLQTLKTAPTQHVRIVIEEVEKQGPSV